MDWSTQCAAAIPCLNEAGYVAAVVRGVRLYLPTVFVVDDGSTDGSAQIAEAAGAQVLRHASNQGKGAALSTAWAEARRRGFRWVLCLDGDGQHDPADLPALLVRAAQTGAELVVGNRFHNGHAGVPFMRRVVNRWMSRQLSRLAGVSLPDTQCGFRLLDLELHRRLDLATQRFEIESELLMAALAAHARVEFVPIRAIYKAGPSKIEPVTDAWRWWRWWRRQVSGARGRRAAPATADLETSPP